MIVLVGFYYEWAIGLLNWLPQNTKTPQTFGYLLILSESSSAFLIAVSLLSFSLILNHLNNLIYRVINLAWLSILTVGVWAYFTDLTFLYIVYILAFTGAVVMLFLSVILMLPASVTANSPASALLFVITETTHASSSGLLFFTILYLSVLFALICIYSIVRHLLPSLKTAKQIGLKTRELFWNCLQNLTDVSTTISSIKALILFIKTFMGINAPTSVFGAFTKNPVNMPALPAWSHIGLYWQNTLYFIYLHVESNLYAGISQTMYRFTQPVWGQLFMVLEYGYAPAKTERQWAFPVRDTHKPYQPAILRYSLFELMPYTLSIFLLKYLHGNSTATLWINRVIFLINCVLFFTVNLLFNIVAYLHIHDIIDFMLLKQVLFTLSISATVVPFNFSNSPALWDKLTVFTGSHSIDSLLAIKEILYENNILFLITSVVGLLIALIGSAVFTRASK